MMDSLGSWNLIHYLRISNKYFLEINRWFREFIWDSRSVKFSLAKLSLLFEEDGLNLSDLQNSKWAYILSNFQVWNENMVEY